jgi:hypothetical protein
MEQEEDEIVVQRLKKAQTCGSHIVDAKSAPRAKHNTASQKKLA